VTCKRIFDRSKITAGLVIARPGRRSVKPPHPVLIAKIKSTTGSDLFVVYGSDPEQITAQAVVKLVFVAADRIDDAADGVAAIKQGRRPGDDLDAVGGKRVDRLRMIF